MGARRSRLPGGLWPVPADVCLMQQSCSYGVLRKQCHKFKAWVRRGSSAGRTLQKMDSGHPPPSSFLPTGSVVAQWVTPVACVGPWPSGLFSWCLEIPFGFQLNSGKGSGWLAFSVTSSARRAGSLRSLIHYCNTDVSEALPQIDLVVLGDFATLQFFGQG